LNRSNPRRDLKRAASVPKTCPQDVVSTDSTKPSEEVTGQQAERIFGWLRHVKRLLVRYSIDPRSLLRGKRRSCSTAFPTLCSPQRRWSTSAAVWAFSLLTWCAEAACWVRKSIRDVLGLQRPSHDGSLATVESSLSLAT
jgi:hypothetical protein